MRTGVEVTLLKWERCHSGDKLLNNKTVDMLKHILLILTVVFVAISCDDMNEFHEKYLKEGEIVYIGKVDSVEILPGNKRAKVKWFLNADPKIKNCKVYWNKRKDSIDIQLDNSEIGGGWYEKLIDLDEAQYLFEFITNDDQNNKSLSVFKSGKVYGDSYQAELKPRKIGSMNATSEEVTINWNAVENLVGVSFQYNNKNNELVKLELDPTADKLVLPDFKIGGAFEYESLFLPEENAIDTFHAPKVQGIFPYTAVPKDNWSLLELADNMSDAYGWVTSRLWDGSTGSGYHSPDNTSYPALLSVDLGAPTIIKSIKMAPRGGFANRLPKKIEIWMSNTANEVGVEATDDQWEAKAAEAGWVKVDEASLSPNTFASINGSEYYRYLRIRVLSVPAGGTTPMNIMEMYLTGAVE
ncbi:hypothetical protein EMN47_13250 [Prolixibacteraceae bacterium JC049]|nr:hypothetical protein [Prolixibacteraceae bacterium JC049]